MRYRFVDNNWFLKPLHIKDNRVAPTHGQMQKNISKYFEIFLSTIVKTYESFENRITEELREMEVRSGPSDGAPRQEVRFRKIVAAFI